MVILRPPGEMALDVPAGRAGRPRGVLLRRFERGSRNARGEKHQVAEHAERFTTLGD
jgi:hypothetical protein